MGTIVCEEYQQLCIFTPVRPFYALTTSSRDKIRSSFEGFFRREILPLIPLQIAQKIYSGKNYGRPINNVVSEVAARIYIKCAGLTENYFLSHVHTDAAIQFALGTEDLEYQPFSRNTFKRQRERIRKYNSEFGTDIWNSITSCVDNAIANKMCLERRFSNTFRNAYRIDSMMIDGHGASMTRLEIIYTTIRLAVEVLHELGVEEYIPPQLGHYLDPKDHNRLLYYKGKLSDVEEECRKHGIPIEAINDANDLTNHDTVNEKKKRRLELIAELRTFVIIQEISVAIAMLESVGLSDIREYFNLVRILNEQTILNEENKRCPKDKKDIQGSSLQNPYDPEMTYRSKNNMGFHGYSGFFAEQFTPEGDGVIVKRYLEQNIYSDQLFAKRFYNEFPDNDKSQIAVCADALFSSHELLALADQKGISIFCASTTGKSPDVILAEFKFTTDRTKILRCPQDHEPVSSEYEDKNGGQIKITFESTCCMDCQYEKACHSYTTKRNPHSHAMINMNQVVAATNIKMLKDPVFRAMVNKRNAVEGIPSVMRRKYNIDEIPYFGLQYAAESFYTDCTAYNVRKLYHRYTRESEYSCMNPENSSEI